MDFEINVAQLSGKRHPAQTIHLRGSSGIDTLNIHSAYGTSDKTARFSIKNNGNGGYELRSNNGSLITLTSIEQIRHNHGAMMEIGCFSSVPVGETVRLSSIMKPAIGLDGKLEGCKR